MVPGGGYCDFLLYFYTTGVVLCLKILKNASFFMTRMVFSLYDLLSGTLVALVAVGIGVNNHHLCPVMVWCSWHMIPLNLDTGRCTIFFSVRFGESLQSKLCTIGSDGTALNTGKHAEVIRQLELSLDRPLQWIICLLHLNELPLRLLFYFLGGKPSGPTTYTSPIGKALEKLASKDIVDFQTVPGKVKPLSIIKFIAN